MKKHSLKQAGFTLVEVMIAVAIVGILAAIAFPSYQAQLRKGKRLEAQNLLMEAASRQQRYFSNQLQYAPDMGTLGYGAAGSNAASTDSNAYQIGVTLGAGNASYTLTATAQASQANDPCGNLTLTDTGVRGQSGSGSLADCWR